jgi:RNA-binding protein YhbY
VHHPDFMYGDIILFLSLAENGKIWGMREVMGAYRKHEGGMTSPNKNGLLKALKFIKHHEAIKVHFGRKYEQAENEILSKAYIDLSKNQLKKYNLRFIKSLIVAYKQEPSKFKKHFLLSYFKIS